MNAGQWIVLAVVIIIAVASIVTAIRIRRSTRIPKIRHINPEPDRPKTPENHIPRVDLTRRRYYVPTLEERFAAKRVPSPRSSSSEKIFPDRTHTSFPDQSGLSTGPMTPGHPLFPISMGGALGNDDTDRSTFPNDRGGDTNDTSSPSGGYESTPTPSSWSSSGDSSSSHSGSDNSGGFSSSHSSDHSGGYSGVSDSGGFSGGDSGGGFGGSE